jgi:hypothetical protein
MSGWRQAVFVRQRRIEVIQRALSRILDEEAWSPATPRRLRIGAVDASSRGWTMILPELAGFFIERGGTPMPRLCRLARELHCPAYEVDVRGATTTLFEVDAFGRLRISGSSAALPAWGRAGNDHGELAIASGAVEFGTTPLADELGARLASVDRARPLALADLLGALAGFPAWTRLGDVALAAGELIFEPPHLVTGPVGAARATAGLRAPAAETREAIARVTARTAPTRQDRRGRRPRSAARPRR